ncbi:MAG: potassium transporter TrkG, partial [Porcipelethomonas sp.]
VVIILLIVFGGIGFLTWEDIGTNKHHMRKYRMQTKVVLVTTVSLIFAPALFFFFFEFTDMPLKERILTSLFQSVTMRTAGFNTTDLTLVGGSGAIIMIGLMLIGGSPGSTAGGMKTTTITVLLSSAVSVFRRKENAHIFKRRIDDSAVKTAASLLMLYLTLFITGGVVISMYDELPLKECLFETASAVGTVGLSLGITQKLSMLSHTILIFLMFCGRVGGLTLIFAAVSQKKNNHKFIKEEITVG